MLQLVQPASLLMSMWSWECIRIHVQAHDCSFKRRAYDWESYCKPSCRDSFRSRNGKEKWTLIFSDTSLPKTEVIFNHIRSYLWEKIENVIMNNQKWNLSGATITHWYLVLPPNGIALLSSSLPQPTVQGSKVFVQRIQSNFSLTCHLFHGYLPWHALPQFQHRPAE